MRKNARITWFVSCAAAAALALLPALAGEPAQVTWTAPDGTRYALGVAAAGTCTPLPHGFACTGTSGSARVDAEHGCGPVKGAAFCVVVGGEFEAPGESGVATASSLVCGEKVYVVSTGTPAGSCTRDAKGRLACVDGGNRASATCATGCGPVTGAASCTIRPRR